jgi:hypothetical protein
MKVFTFLNDEKKGGCHGSAEGRTRPWKRDADTKLTALCSPPPWILGRDPESTQELSRLNCFTLLRATGTYVQYCHLVTFLNLPVNKHMNVNFNFFWDVPPCALVNSY